MATQTITVSEHTRSIQLANSAMEPVKIGSLLCKPIRPTFGAEVEGVDFSKPISEAQIKDIISAEDRFGVTVYRNTGLTDEGHVTFSRQLGELEKMPKLGGMEGHDRFKYPELFDITNLERDGSIVKEGSKRWWFGRGNSLWHTDSSFNQHRSKYSLLLAHAVPKDGGNTDYADVRQAFRDLPEDRKAMLRGLVAKHDLWHSRKLGAPEIADSITESDIAAKPPAYHKLVQTAPDGGETLFIASHISEIVGMPKQSGQQLIRELIEHCTQPKYTFSFKWNQSGDLVFWDNRQTMHRATPFEEQNEVRDMRRTTVFDDGPEKYGVPQDN